MTWKERIHRVDHARAVLVDENSRKVSTLIGTQVITDDLEEAALQQIYDVSRIPRVKPLVNTPDTHVGHGCTIGQVAAWDYNTGMVSPSIVGVDIGCGMSVMRTGIMAADLDKPTVRQLMKAIEARVPVGFGQTVKESISEEVMAAGACGDWKGAAQEIGGVDESDVIEPTYGEPVYINDLPIVAREAGLRTLGSLGGGNHFIELQVAQVMPDMDDLADKWGICNGELLVMLHSGSRGAGFKTAKFYEERVKAEMEKWGVPLLNPGLCYVPRDTELGYEYLCAQLAATNLAKLNRYLMRHRIIEAFDEVLQVRPETVYDLSHNVAYKLPFGPEGVLLVHRKGATLALPPGHFLNPKKYKQTGHPVLIPGSMGTSSYILVGREEAADTYYSVNHGAGRRMSRRQAVDSISVERFAESLQVQNGLGEVLINTRNLKEFLDEAPDAYKNIDEVIASVEGAGLASSVVRCVPLAVLKGKDREFPD